MKPSKDNSYCYYPFKQLAISHWNQDGIQCVNPCCNMASPVDPDPLQTNKNIHNNVEELFNLPQLQNIRTEMLEGKYPQACQGCYNAEKTMGNSPRLMLDTAVDNRLEWLDIHLGNKCNLRCRMCHPALSNQLNKDAELFEKNGYKYWWSSIPDIEPHDIRILYPVLKDITNIRVSGGEPLLSNQFLECLIGVKAQPCGARGARVIAYSMPNICVKNLKKNKNLPLGKIMWLTLLLKTGRLEG